MVSKFPEGVALPSDSVVCASCCDFGETPAAAPAWPFADGPFASAGAAEAGPLSVPPFASAPVAAGSLESDPVVRRLLGASDFSSHCAAPASASVASAPVVIPGILN